MLEWLLAIDKSGERAAKRNSYPTEANVNEHSHSRKHYGGPSENESLKTELLDSPATPLLVPVHRTGESMLDRCLCTLVHCSIVNKTQKSPQYMSAWEQIRKVCMRNGGLLYLKEGILSFRELEIITLRGINQKNSYSVISNVEPKKEKSVS